MTINTAMVMSAGLGTRMRPLTDACPKPLLKVAGTALIDRSLDHVAAAGLSRAIVNLHYLGPMIRAHLAGRTRPEIVFSDETDLLLETGGGIVRALPVLGEAPFVTMNSDAVWRGESPLTALLDGWDAAAMSALLLVVPRAAAMGYTRPGDFFLEDGCPVRRGEFQTAPYVYSGAQIICPGAFAGAPEGPFSTNLIWDALIAAGRLRAVVYPGAWVDVGTPEGLALADDLMRGPT